MEGYWNSGKFYRRAVLCDQFPRSMAGAGCSRDGGTYLRGIADFQEASSSVKDCGIVVSGQC